MYERGNWKVCGSDRAVGSQGLFDQFEMLIEGRGRDDVCQLVIKTRAEMGREHVSFSYVERV